MGLFTPVKKHPNRFNYIPRYYDPVKEAREQRRRELRGERGEDIDTAVAQGEYKPGDAAYAAVYLPYAGQYRMFFETLERKNDNAEVWAEMDAYGFNVIMCNTNIYELTRFIADRYFS